MKNIKLFLLFVLCHSGDGSWMRTIIDEEFNKGLNQ